MASAQSARSSKSSTSGSGGGGGTASGKGGSKAARVRAGKNGKVKKQVVAAKAKVPRAPRKGGETKAQYRARKDAIHARRMANLVNVAEKVRPW